jgi:hypothetical protein
LVCPPKGIYIRSRRSYFCQTLRQQTDRAHPYR